MITTRQRERLRLGNNDRRRVDHTVHPALKTALEAWPRNHVAILANKTGEGTSVHGFGVFMGDAIDRAKPPTRCALHGLCEAAARRLAEAGCSTLQIMGTTGHKKLADVERYPEATQKIPRAKDAINRLTLSTQSRKVDKKNDKNRANSI